MIRPLTVATFLLACSSGLYLYQSKHEVQVLDRTIERTVHETGALREQSRLLAAEWTMLTSPERLRQFSDTYLNLKTISPSQFTSLNDLNSRLPAPRVATPAGGPDEEAVPVTVDTAPAPVAEGPQGMVAHDAMPVPPPAHAVRPVAAVPVAKLPDPKVAAARTGNEAPARPAAVEAHATEARVAEARVAEQRAAQRVAETKVMAREAPVVRPIVLAAPRPVPAPVPVYVAPAPAATQHAAAPAPAYGGSLLGMAHGTLPPAPRPTPVNASYNTN